MKISFFDSLPNLHCRNAPSSGGPRFPYNKSLLLLCPRADIRTQHDSLADAELITAARHNMPGSELRALGDASIGDWSDTGVGAHLR